ncbi:MAG: hypothetical protein HY290_06090 [Planctomycetia bacterium]|nr:hypothetical protein [Planctomycetia bacterium]
MLRNEDEFRRAVASLTEKHLKLVDRRYQLRYAGLPDEQIDELVADLTSGCRRLEEEIELYERRTTRTWVPAE